MMKISNSLKGGRKTSRTENEYGTFLNYPGFFLGNGPGNPKRSFNAVCVGRIIQSEQADEQTM